jgi:hypothetical protein
MTTIIVVTGNKANEVVNNEQILFESMLGNSIRLGSRFFWLVSVYGADRILYLSSSA